jgi:pimeloyl-ACP methyl ester carboxylesterase
MTLSMCHPSRVSRLVIVDIAPRWYDMSYIRDYIAWMKEIETQRLSRDQAFEFLKDRLGGNVAIGQFLLTNYVKQQTSDEYRFRIPLDIIERSLEQLQDFPSVFPSSTTHQTSLTPPCLLIYGAQSTYVQVETDTSLVLRMFPKTRFSSIPDAGHWLHVEKPQLFLQLVADFIKQTADLSPI